MKRTVRKITPSQLSSFDQQFWPVVVAVTVLSAIAIGAVLTILKGPWMWGSLFALPLLSIFSIVLLYHVDNRRVRRSFQFAIFLSLSAHLLVMIFASVVNVFVNPYKVPERKVAQRQVRTIEISDQRASFVWEEVNSRETPEPQVEPERANQPTAKVKPQPIPVKEQKPQVTPQLTRRETPKQSVPRQSQELSQLRRQRDNMLPRSSQKQTGPVSEVAAKQAPAKTEREVTESSKRADQVARKVSQPSATSTSSSASAAAASMPEPKIEVTRTPASPRRAAIEKEVAISQPSPSPSSARIRRSTPRIPTPSASAQANRSEVAKATTNQPRSLQPAKAAGELSRRPNADAKPRTATVAAQTPRLTVRSQVARAASRRDSRTQRPTISNPSSETFEPRRSTIEARLASSPTPVERPSRAPESQTVSRELNAKTLSVSRANSGATGAGRTMNLERFAGGQPSPATRASDSARRERAMSRPSDVRLLSSSQKSQVRRTRGEAVKPSSTLLADTSASAKIAGLRKPSDTSLESSAAQIDSASTANRDRLAAERGSAMVDLGPTKVVQDQTVAQRRSGGGQMEVSQMSPETTRRSRDQSSVQPSLAAATGVEVAAPRNLSAAPASALTLEPSSDAAVASRIGGDASSAAERVTAVKLGEASEEGEVDLDALLADTRDMGKAEQLESGTQQDNDREDDNDEDNRKGRSRSRLAQAPAIRSDAGLGIAQNSGNAKTRQNETGDEVLESSVADVVQRSAGVLSGTGIAPAATQLFANSTSSLPLMAPASTAKRAISREVSTALAETGETGTSTRPNRRKNRDARPNLEQATEIGGTGDEGTATAADNVTSRSGLEARAVDVARMDNESGRQLQGFKLEVEAMEGPAGLAENADENIGVLARPASKDSEQLMPDLDNRFRNRDFGGVLATNPDAVVALDAFRDRSPAAMSRMSNPSTEAAIQLGLEFLARYQTPDGSWSLKGFDRQAPQTMTQLDSDTAATGLAVLAFQGAGYNHREYKYAQQLDQAINWLLENQTEDGGLYVDSDTKSNAACRLYSHGIAALALTEAYGMTQDPKLKEPAQRALNFICETQDGRKGGWRYFTEMKKRSADTSVSGWMMMALQSGRLAGLDVPRDTFDGVEDWLDDAADPDNASLYRYNPYAVDSKGISRIQGKRPSPAMTSVGLLMRIYSGWGKDDPRLIAGADYLLNTQLPSDGTPVLRDTYYWYYATQVLKHVDGERWERWDQRLRPLLTSSQEKSGELAGSWHPYRPVPDRWGAFGGRLYVTTMNLLSLEVRHRLLPLYQDGAPSQILGIIESGELLDDKQIADIRDRKLAPELADTDVSVADSADRSPAMKAVPNRISANSKESEDRTVDGAEVIAGSFDLVGDAESMRKEKALAEGAGQAAVESPPVLDLPKMLQPNLPAMEQASAAAEPERFGPVESETRVALTKSNSNIKRVVETVQRQVRRRPRLNLPEMETTKIDAFRVAVGQDELAKSPRDAVQAGPTTSGMVSAEPVERSGSTRRRDASLDSVAVKLPADAKPRMAPGQFGPVEPETRVALTKSNSNTKRVVETVQREVRRRPNFSLAEIEPMKIDAPRVTGSDARELAKSNRDVDVPLANLTTLGTVESERNGLTRRRDARLAPDAVELKMPAEAKPRMVKPPEPSEVRFGEIAGQVMLDGEPLPRARVAFLPIDDASQPDASRIAIAARTNRLGQFSITSSNTKSGKGLAIGIYQIRITTVRSSDDVEVIDLLELVPTKYNQQTTLTVSVKPGDGNKLDFDLESEIK